MKLFDVAIYKFRKKTERWKGSFQDPFGALELGKEGMQYIFTANTFFPT
jgi:hypothetical protein